MNGFIFRIIFLTVFSAAAAVFSFSPVLAGPTDFLKKLTGGQSVEADPKKEYTLTETNGPWMVLVHTFSGPKGREQANALVLELRKEYKFKAYSYNHIFVSDTHLDKDLKTNPYSKTRPQYKKKGKFDEYAVVLGDFQSVDDLDLQKTLKSIRQIYPECMKSFPGQQIPNGTPSPFQFCLAVTNPILNSNYFNQPGAVDDFVAKLNESRPYSLLNCPGRFSVQVATFTGKVEIKPQNVEDIITGKKPFLENGKSELEIGEKAAAKLCKILRSKGYEAFEFHDRYASIVTIGAFDSCEHKLPNGMVEYPPQIAALMRDFQAKPAKPTAANAIAYDPVKFDGIECDVQPVIIVVPRKKR
ncbi:hypothetical protein FACS1894214_3410 [Planctomycetales bacterium]|nr:hypothetical protein FACS1894214_3410 [Planctomycetales bacterium]